MVDKEIRQLQRKFFRLSAVISFTVIALMLIALNILMQLSYQNDQKSAADFIMQTAIVNAPAIDEEQLQLNALEITEEGDYIVKRNIKNIESITMYGTITCSVPNVSWYNAGGGILFELIDEEDSPVFVHREYKFNNDNTEITLDFSSYDNFMLGNDPIDIEASQLSEEYFLISPVWWASSSQGYFGNSNDVSLVIDSILIRYIESFSAASSEDYRVVQRDFSALYPNGEPETIASTRRFYIITDKSNNIIEINNGNLSTTIAPEMAAKFLHSASKMLEIGNMEYQCSVSEKTI